MPKHRLIKGQGIDDFARNLYISQCNRFNYNVDKKITNQVSR